VFSKKLVKTVSIGIITKSEIKNEDMCQKFIFIIYNPPYKNEKYLCPCFRKEIPKHGHLQKIKNQILLGYAEPP
jgi:hypothetical protein|tara:strand:+ start:628 stop:849 length:222 start_codon:yes stop_codon:yes gene_type:complete